MPRVLRIINRLNIGGPTFNATYLTKYLAPEFETLLVSGMKDETEGDSSHIATSLGIQPIYIPDMHREIKPFRDLKGYRQLRKIIADFKPDIVHTHAAKAGALGRLAAAHAGVPVIVHTFHGHVFHSYFSPLKTRVFINLERYLATLSTGIVAISPTQKHELADVYSIAPEKKIEIIPNGFDLSRFQNNQPALRQAFRELYALPDDTVAIGIIGRLVSVKNHRLFLESLWLLKKNTQQKFRAFIIGDGEDRPALEEYARMLGLRITSEPGNTDADVVFTSWILDIERACAGLDIIALSSHNEGTPVTLVEAQAAAKPVVSTQVGGVADIVLHGQSGLLVPPSQNEPFARALQQLVENPAKREAFGKVGQEHALAHFGYVRLVRDMGNYYARLLRQKGRM